MRERTSLEDQINGIAKLEGDLDDALTLIELGEMEADQASIEEGELAIKAVEVEAFVRRVQRQLRRGLVVVMDRLSAHKAAAQRLAGDDRFEVEWLPPYAPDLNPAEGVWSHTKHCDLANYAADDLLDLEIEAELSLENTRGDQNLLRSFFDGAGLKV